MEVVVDGRQGWARGSVRGTVAQFLDTVQAALGRRRIVTLTLDGEVLTKERQSEVMAQDTSGFGLLEIKTVDVGTLAAETLKGILAHLRNLDALHAEAKKLVERGEYARSGDRLMECCGAWDTFSRALRDVAALGGVELKTLEVSGVRTDERIRMLTQTLMRFRGAMEFRDIMRVSELADKDLQPSVDHWRAVIEELARRIRT